MGLFNRKPDPLAARSVGASVGRYMGDPIAVTDKNRAKTFYEGTLGLSGIERSNGGTTYDCGAGQFLHVFPSSDQGSGSLVPGDCAGNFYVEDLEGVVADLELKGIACERSEKDEKIAGLTRQQKYARFTDPDGNRLALMQEIWPDLSNQPAPANWGD